MANRDISRDTPPSLPTEHPMYLFTNPRLTPKEVVIKQEVDAYVISDIEKGHSLQIGRRVHAIVESLDLPDADCNGLTYKRRLVLLQSGKCYLLARWKPDRYLRRTSIGVSQKWFVEKELFPSNLVRFFAKFQPQEPATPKD